MDNFYKCLKHSLDTYQLLSITERRLCLSIWNQILQKLSNKSHLSTINVQQILDTSWESCKRHKDDCETQISKEDDKGILKNNKDKHRSSILNKRTGASSDYSDDEDNNELFCADEYELKTDTPKKTEISRAVHSDSSSHLQQKKVEKHNKETINLNVNRHINPNDISEKTTDINEENVVTVTIGEAVTECASKINKTIINTPAISTSNPVLPEPVVVVNLSSILDGQTDSAQKELLMNHEKYVKEIFSGNAFQHKSKHERTLQPQEKSLFKTNEELSNSNINNHSTSTRTDDMAEEITHISGDNVVSVMVEEPTSACESNNSKTVTNVSDKVNSEQALPESVVTINLNSIIDGQTNTAQKELLMKHEDFIKEVFSASRKRSCPRTVPEVKPVSVAEEKPGGDQHSGPSMPKKKSTGDQVGRQIVHEKKPRGGRRGRPSMHEKRPGDDRSVTCEVCGKQVHNSSNLIVHMRMHTGNKPYKCTVCGLGFSVSSNLKRHMRNHEGIKPYACEVCEKKFAEKKTLTIHMRTHTKEKPYKCELCDMAFSQLTSLKTHMVVHTGIKGFLCDLCGQSFGQRSGLHIHRKRHFAIREFKCQHCDKDFVTAVEKDRHEIAHTNVHPFLCSVCPKKFVRLSALEDHMNWHEGKKPHQCETCSEAFCDRLQLKRHKTQHKSTTSLTPVNEGQEYKCTKCHAKFRTAVARHNHMLSRVCVKTFNAFNQCRDCLAVFLSTAALAQHVVDSGCTQKTLVQPISAQDIKAELVDDATADDENEYFAINADGTVSKILLDNSSSIDAQHINTITAAKEIIHNGDVTDSGQSVDYDVKDVISSGEIIYMDSETLAMEEGMVVEEVSMYVQDDVDVMEEVVDGSSE